MRERLLYASAEAQLSRGAGAGAGRMSPWHEEAGHGEATGIGGGGATAGALEADSPALASQRAVAGGVLPTSRDSGLQALLVEAAAERRRACGRAQSSGGAAGHASRLRSPGGDGCDDVCAAANGRRRFLESILEEGLTLQSPPVSRRLLPGFPVRRWPRPGDATGCSPRRPGRRSSGRCGGPCRAPGPKAAVPSSPA